AHVVECLQQDCVECQQNKFPLMGSRRALHCQLCAAKLQAMSKRPSTVDCYCPCCDTEFPAFLDWSPDYRNVVCPNCDSHPRHRVFWLSVQQSGLLHGKNLKLLHFAPEGILRRLVSSSADITYITADREQVNVDVWLDVTMLPCPDQCFDVVLCSHVLSAV